MRLCGGQFYCDSKKKTWVKGKVIVKKNVIKTNKG